MKKEISSAFDDLIKQINQVAGDIQRERGTLFEKLVLTYLKNEPIYQRLYKNVWVLNDVPEEYGIPKKDTGVDCNRQVKLNTFRSLILNSFIIKY